MPTNNIRQETPCNECSDKYQAASVPPPPDCEYQEFGAEMGGNSLIIRVHKDNARVDQLKDESCCCEPGGKPKPAVYQVSQSSPCTCSNQAAGAATRKGGVCPDCCPDNKTPFTFKMGGTTQADNQISVFSPTKNDPSDNKLGTLADPTKEVFILRIGKKNESASKKNNMEIELCTPRGKEFKPPQPKTDTEQQCDAQEVKAEKGKKGKGKKGKGKKGKGKGKKKK
ncbi:uncharacterized protein [Atheta coriaria]|uniref:uncharacterized protein n=1 Tax=Dalotia coriaria TaxID=877792 RepID=UPI0031F3EA2D